jgi:hypothetical protein
VIGEAARHAAFGRDHVDIEIAVVLAGKSDQLAVGRELGVGFDADATGELPRVAAIARDQPQIARIRKDDLGLAYRRALQKQRLVVLSEAACGRQKAQG